MLKTETEQVKRHKIAANREKHTLIGINYSRH